MKVCYKSRKSNLDCPFVFEFYEKMCSPIVCLLTRSTSTLHIYSLVQIYKKLQLRAADLLK